MANKTAKNSDFHERLKSLRMQKGLSQRAFSAKIGVNYVQYNRYEKGERKPSAETLPKLADALGVSVDYLLDGNAEDAAVANMADKDFLKMFERAEKLPEHDKEHIKALLDAFLRDKEMKNLYAS